MGEQRAAVIGSGFGGLALAIRLQSAGFRTVIFEKRDKPGGRAYVYRDGGFTFDAGPTVITAPDCLRELFGLSGRSMENYVRLLPVDPFYRLFWQDGFTFDYSGDAGLIEAQIAGGALQRAGLIQYSRGQITVVDRAGLEAAACECYETIRKEFARALAA